MTICFCPKVVVHVVATPIQRSLGGDGWCKRQPPALHELCPYFQFPAFIKLHKLSHNIDDESGGEAEDSENGLRPLALSWSRAPSSVKDAPGFQPWSPGASAWRGWKLPGLHRNLIAALSTNLWPEDKGSILVNFCPFHRTVTRHKLLRPVFELPTHFHLIS